MSVDHGSTGLGWVEGAIESHERSPAFTARIRSWRRSTRADRWARGAKNGGESS